MPLKYFWGPKYFMLLSVNYLFIHRKANLIAMHLKCMFDNFIKVCFKDQILMSGTNWKDIQNLNANLGRPWDT